MHPCRQYLALLCVLLLLTPAGYAAGPQANPPAGPPQGRAEITSTAGPRGWFGAVARPYKLVTVPPANLANSNRLESLLRAGNIYLSLQDCIALALENNLDIAIQRYAPLLSDAAVKAAMAGGFARGVSTSVTAGPASASVSSSGTTAGTNQNATSQASAGTSSAVGSSVLSSSGPSIPSLDPMLTGSANWAHATAPQSSAFVTGTNFLITRQDTNAVNIQKGFLSGTNVSLGLTNNTSTNNSMRADFNPATSSSLGISFSQHLLQGFGFGVNGRQIRIAKNNREVSDLTFKLQVITTVVAVVELYWDLVSFRESVKVAQDALTASQKLLADNQKQVEVGTLAPIEIIPRRGPDRHQRTEPGGGADARAATGDDPQDRAQQDRPGQPLRGREAHVIPTDVISMPGVEPIAPIQEMTAQAIASRPELAQSRIQLTNQELTIKGSKNSLLPTLDVVANLANNALAGQVNPIPAPVGTLHSNTPFFVGGYGTVLSQLFARNFPNYSAGFSLNVPIRNRARAGSGGDRTS